MEVQPAPSCPQSKTLLLQNCLPRVFTLTLFCTTAPPQVQNTTREDLGPKASPGSRSAPTRAERKQAARTGDSRARSAPRPPPTLSHEYPDSTHTHRPSGHVTSGAASRDHFRDRPRLRRVPQRACAGGGGATGVRTEPTRVSSEWAGVSFEPRDSEIPGRATLSHRGFRLPITSRKLTLQVGSRRASLLITPKA